jgi:hypothetical protein
MTSLPENPDGQASNMHGEIEAHRLNTNGHGSSGVAGSNTCPSRPARTNEPFEDKTLAPRTVNKG